MLAYAQVVLHCNEDQDCHHFVNANAENSLFDKNGLGTQDYTQEGKHQVI